MNLLPKLHYLLSGWYFSPRWCGTSCSTPLSRTWAGPWSSCHWRSWRRASGGRDCSRQRLRLLRSALTCLWCSPLWRSWCWLRRKDRWQLTILRSGPKWKIMCSEFPKSGLLSPENNYVHTVEHQNLKVRISALFIMVPFPNSYDFGQCPKTGHFCPNFRRSLCSVWFVRFIF